MLLRIGRVIGSLLGYISALATNIHSPKMGKSIMMNGNSPLARELNYSPKPYTRDELF